MKIPKELPKDCRKTWKRYYGLLVSSGLWNESKIDNLVSFCFTNLMIKKHREFIINKNMSLMEEVPYMMSCGPETTLKESESSKILRKLNADSGRLYKLLELHKIKYEDPIADKPTGMEGMLDG